MVMQTKFTQQKARKPRRRKHQFHVPAGREEGIPQNKKRVRIINKQRKTTKRRIARYVWGCVKTHQISWKWYNWTHKAIKLIICNSINGRKSYTTIYCANSYYVVKRDCLQPERWKRYDAWRLNIRHGNGTSVVVLVDGNAAHMAKGK